MNINYNQATGHITDESGDLLAVGWAGNGDGKNNPGFQEVPCVGPLPQGLYEVAEWEHEHNGLGHDVVALHQIEGETYGRSGFFIHGPSVNPDHYGQESRGCIVVPREGRLKLEDLKPVYVRVTGPVAEVAPEPVPEVPPEVVEGV
jgi:hypothetical protein